MLALLTWKGLVIQKPERVWLLTYLTHPSIKVLTRLFETCCLWWSSLIHGYFHIYWDLQVSRHHGCLHSGTSCTKEIFMLAACSGRYWHLDFDIGLTVDPFSDFKTLLFSQMFALHIFCNLVLRLYTGSLGCIRD